MASLATGDSFLVVQHRGYRRLGASIAEMPEQSGRYAAPELVGATNAEQLQMESRDSLTPGKSYCTLVTKSMRRVAL